jgi:biotin synthase
LNGELKCVASAPRGDFNRLVLESPYVPKEPDLCLKGSAQEVFHERAMEAARERFGRRVFVRGVVEVSNYCRENCAYCGMRRDNRSLSRYRADHEQLAEMLIHRRPASITDVNIQAGEDPVAVRQVVLPLIRTLRRETRLGVSVCVGTLTRQLYDELQAAGATIYIMKFECGDAVQYKKFEAPGTLEERLQHIRHLAESGWKVSSGFVVGLPGQTLADLVSNLRLAETLPLHGCSVSPFIPGEDTPLAGYPSADANWTLNCMAALRLMQPDWVIPAVSALNLAEKNGYLRGLRAGANLVTMNLTPGELRGDYLIYKRGRFIMTEERVLDVIAAAGLTPSRQSLADYYRHRKRRAETSAFA